MKPSLLPLRSIAELISIENLAAPLPSQIDLRGWNSDHPIFDRLVAETNPSAIIQVGAWLGRATQHLALASASLTAPDEVSGAPVPVTTAIYDVDTWLGGIDHMLSGLPQDDLLRDAHGSPRLYHQYLRNFVGERAIASRVYPVQNTSLNGARLLARHGISAELIYLDGSHEYEDVYADLCAYAQLLKPGGVIFGDDFRSFPGVFAAVLRFSHECSLKVEEVASNFWILRAA